MTRVTKIILVVVIALQCVGIFDHSLWTPDEPRVAEISREMAVSGNYLIPHHAGRPFLEQPPWYYATAALGFKWWGTGNEGYGRLASAFYGILTLLVVLWGVRRLYSGYTAGLAAAILASSLLFFQVTHKMLVDSALVFFTTLALFGFHLSFTDQYKHGFKLFWIGMALSFLTKGLIGIAIPGVAAAAFILWQGDLSVIRRIWAVPGLLLLLGVIGLWSWVLYQAGGTDFLWTFYGYHQLGRFFNGGIYTGGHFRPFYYYLGDFWVQGAPWSLLIIPFFISMRPLDTSKRFLIAWLAGGLVLLSLSSTKRGLYLLPLMPAMAVIIAIWMADLSGRMLKRWERAVLNLMGSLFVLCFVGLVFGYVRFLDGSWVIAVAVTTACMLAIWFIFATSKPDRASLLVIVWCLVLLLWTPALFPQIDRHKSYKERFAQIGRVVADQPVAGYQLSETAEALAPFYGGFHVENIEDRRTFQLYLAQKQTAYVMVLPSRLDAGLRRQLLSIGIPLINTPTRMRKEIELWKIGP